MSLGEGAFPLFCVLSSQQLSCLEGIDHFSPGQVVRGG